MANDPSFILHAPTPLTNLCESLWAKYHDDCSGYARAVAEKCGVFLGGNANDIVSYAADYWDVVDDGKSASDAAQNGQFVIAGLANKSGHGHVVVIVPGMKGKYPMAYWGRLHELSFKIGNKTIKVNLGIGRRNEPISAAWRHDVLPHVIYRSTRASSLIRGF